MNGLADAFRQLVERKLWPVALLLMAALIAVPVLLASDPAPVASPTASVPGGEDASDPIVSLRDAGDSEQERAVLGDRKDPFRPAQLHRVKQAEDVGAGATATAATAVTKGAAGDGDAAKGGGGGETPALVTPPVVVTPVPPKKTFDLYSLQVRFGDTAGELKTRNVKRLTGLPSGANPAVLYIGLLDDHKTAVFIVDAGVTALGDGTCDPSPENCQTLTLREGETEFFTRGTKQYELDLVKIHTKKTTSAREAKASRLATAAGGREALRARLGRIGAYRYSEVSGTLDKVERPKRRRGSNTSASRFTPSG